MKRIITLLTLIHLLIVLGCAKEEVPREMPEMTEQALTDTHDHLPTHTYYEVRIDYRKCMFPMCGGYFVSRINHNYTRCEDGSYSEDGCYVAEMILPKGINLSQGDIVSGVIGTKKYETIGEFSVFNAKAVYTDVHELPPEFAMTVLIHDSGIRCFTTPCESHRIAMLNSHKSTTKYGFDFEAETESDKELLREAFYREFAELGAIVEGHWSPVWISWWDYEWQFTITNVLATKQSLTVDACVVAQDGNSTTAWNFDDIAEAEEFAKGIDATVRKGTCADQVIFCPAMARPVHGTIDAFGDECIEASNSCKFSERVVHAAGSDQPGKAKGTWTDGLCQAPEKGCLVFTEDDWTFAYNTVEDFKNGITEYNSLNWYPGEICDEVSTHCMQVYQPVCGRIEPPQGDLPTPHGNMYFETFSNRCFFDAAIRKAVGHADRARGDVVYAGECIDNEKDCIAVGGHVIWSPGSAVHCPEDEKQIGFIPMGIEGGICCL